MGQVPHHLNETRAIEAEVDALRRRTEQIAAELERRVRDRVSRAKHSLIRVKRVLDVRTQLREHRSVVIGAAAVTTVAFGIGAIVAARRALEARRPQNRLRARLRGYRALLDNPRRALRKREPLGRRLLSALLVAGATAMARGLAGIFLKQQVEPRLLPPRRTAPRELPLI